MRPNDGKTTDNDVIAWRLLGDVVRFKKLEPNKIRANL